MREEAADFSPRVNEETENTRGLKSTALVRGWIILADKRQGYYAANKFAG
jgi:hypothetical protein